MLNSTPRKLLLSGWLHANSPKEYYNPLKLQKFLFFYEAFSKTEDKKYEFSSLKGYVNGPVFSNVWGDYTYNNASFCIEASKHYQMNSINIDLPIASRSSFLVSIMSEKELSHLTHTMDIWKAKKELINKGLKHVELDEKDFSSNDNATMKLLKNMYPDELIKNTIVININHCYFLFRKFDIPKLTTAHHDALNAISESEDLSNPIFVEIDERGCLIID